MIRLFSVFCKLNQIRFSDRQWLEWDSRQMLSAAHSCPHCQEKGTLSVFSHYQRYLVEWDSTKQVSHTVTIKRYICSSCGHTHSGLSSCVVPYKSYSLRFILTVLRDYFIRVSSVEKICGHFEISISTLYRWVALFLCHKELWLKELEVVSHYIVDFLDSVKGSFLHRFFCMFHFSFLESFHNTGLKLLKRSGYQVNST